MQSCEILVPNGLSYSYAELASLGMQLQLTLVHNDKPFTYSEVFFNYDGSVSYMKQYRAVPVKKEVAGVIKSKIQSILEQELLTNPEYIQAQQEANGEDEFYNKIRGLTRKDERIARLLESLVEKEVLAEYDGKPKMSRPMYELLMASYVICAKTEVSEGFYEIKSLLDAVKSYDVRKYASFCLQETQPKSQ
ncbi:hypothetical protein D6777_01585 [Candidatus Woesearchaeota archaeon]|nr:MAG: hypothetical protein D6777_01585 [Candidatus Woesearchaeota archaeon]